MNSLRQDGSFWQYPDEEKRQKKRDAELRQREERRKRETLDRVFNCATWAIVEDSEGVKMELPIGDAAEMGIAVIDTPSGARAVTERDVLEIGWRCEGNVRYFKKTFRIEGSWRGGKERGA